MTCPRPDDDKWTTRDEAVAACRNRRCQPVPCDDHWHHARNPRAARRAAVLFGRARRLGRAWTRRQP